MKFWGILLGKLHTFTERCKNFGSKVKNFHTQVINESVYKGIMDAQMKQQGTIGREITIYKNIFNEAKKPVVRDVKNIKKIPKEIQ